MSVSETRASSCAIDSPPTAMSVADEVRRGNESRDGDGRRRRVRTGRRRALRLEGELAKAQALRRREDRVDLGLVGAGLLEGKPDALGGGDEPPTVAEGLHPALSGAGGELGHLGPLAVVETQVVERGGWISR